MRLSIHQSAFNSQTAHAVVLLGENHQKLWDITFGELEKFLPNEEAKAATKGKIDSFAAAYGTILFFEDHDVVKGLQEQFPSYADNFPIWSEQSTGDCIICSLECISRSGRLELIFNTITQVIWMKKVAAEWDNSG